MCFAPYISLSTFVIEFLLAIYFLFQNPKDKLNQMIALISFLLGLYQLNEFLICVTEINLFARFAMIVTAVLPALAVTYALIMRRNKLKFYWHSLIYLPAVFFITMFSMPFYFTKLTVCDTVFIQYPGLGLLGKFYALYYLTYLLASAILAYLGSHDSKTKQERYLYYLGMLSMLIFTVPTVIFLFFLPMFYVQFPSVLCEFGLLLAIEFVFLLWYKEKHNITYSY